jgi:hypothetical protein
MLKIKLGRNHRFCDGVSRRSFLKIGSLTVGGVALGGMGLSLPQLLAAEERAGIKSSTKAVINVHLSGGPSHQDIFDLKPDAPSEFRGQFQPISTNVGGMDICEHLPRLATMADKFAIIRSLIGSSGQHSNYQTHSAYDQRDLRNAGGRPSLGSVVAKVAGPSASGAPAFISYNGGSPGYLGPVYKPYEPMGGSLKMHPSLSEARLDNRTNLLTSLDRFRRDVDGSGQMEALDSFTQRAVGVVTSGAVAKALDNGSMDPKDKERYGKDAQQFLTARRLVEAGVRVVTLSWGGWDTHGGNFTTLKRQLPNMDRGLASLLTDLADRGMDKDVSVVVWGEFGRTPRVNNNAGRDHWPSLMMCFLAGGGMKLGQVIGSSTRNAEYAKDRPVHFQEVFATLYHNLGIDVNSVQLYDTAGRPQYLLDKRTPLRELVG